MDDSELLTRLDNMGRVIIDLVIEIARESDNKISLSRLRNLQEDTYKRLTNALNCMGEFEE